VTISNVSQTLAGSSTDTSRIPSFTGSTDVWFLFSDVSDDQPTWDTTTAYTDTEGTFAISSAYLTSNAVTTATFMSGLHAQTGAPCVDNTDAAVQTCTVLIAGAASLVAASLVASAALAF
jgi:hypothetical protein